MAVVAIAAVALGYFYLKFREKQRFLEILHEERLSAVEKGIPLPELPIEPLFVKTEKPIDFRTVMLIGIVLLFFGAGAMLSMWLMPAFRSLWPAPLPVTFIGGGLLIAFFASKRPEFGR